MITEGYPLVILVLQDFDVHRVRTEYRLAMKTINLLHVRKKLNNITPEEFTAEQEILDRIQQDIFLCADLDVEYSNNDPSFNHDMRALNIKIWGIESYEKFITARKHKGV